MRRLRLLLATLLVGAASCAADSRSLVGWDPELRRTYPSAAVVLRSVNGGGHGVVVHSSPARGTFVLTNRHVAKEVCVSPSGGAPSSFVDVMDLDEERRVTLQVEAFVPDTAALASELSLEPGPGALRRFLESDLALLRVVGTRPLPCARLGALPVGVDVGSCFAMPIRPRERPQRITFGGPPTSSVVWSSGVPVKGMSGSGIFDAKGDLYGLLAARLDEEARRKLEKMNVPPEGEGNAGVVTLEAIVAWLRANELGWIADAPR